MNKTLEAIAKSIFKHWFIDFEFPNEEGKPYKSNDGKMIDSELGEIPESWTVGCLSDIANNVRNPVKPEDVEPETPYIGLEHMPRRSIALADWGHAEDVSSNKSSFHRKDVLFGKLRPYFHKVGVAPIDGFCSTDILVITAKQPESFGVVLFHFASDELVKYADMASSGTKMPRTSWSDLAQHKISIPSKEIMRDFTDIISPMVDKIIGNVLQSRTLVSIRDSLLPKLMSGKIRVPVTNENVEVR
jgi:type I restriction enzyme S subunit